MPSSKSKKAVPAPRAADPTPPPAWINALLVALAAVFLIGLFSTELADTDSWWHLKTGEYVFTHHRLPYPDPFAYTTAMAKPSYPGEAETQYFNLTHEWLAQITMYLAEAAGGLGGVVLWKALLLALACSLTGHVVRLRTTPPLLPVAHGASAPNANVAFLWGVAAMLAAAPVVAVFAHDRPSILSYVFSILFIAIFEETRGPEGRLPGSFRQNLLFLLPPLALVWANCHGGFFLAWIVCGAYCAEAVIRRASGRNRILGVSAAAVLLSGVNPNGFRVVTTLASYRNSPMTSTLMEWSHPGFWGEPYAFYILLYSAAILLAMAWRRVRISDALLFLAFAAASLTAFRNLPLTALFAPIAIATYFPAPAGAASSWPQRAATLTRAASYLAPVLIAGGIVWGVVSGAFFQLRAAEWRFPAGAATFLHEHAPAARVFNTYEEGGYLIWRGIPVFIDGRSLSENVFQDYRLILGAPPGDPRRDETLARYSVDAIVVNAFEYNSGVIYPLVFALSQPSESAWNLVYDDPAAMVFMRNPGPGVQALSKTRMPDHLEAECALHVSRDPEFSLCARTLGDLFLQMGDRDRARRNLALYLEHPYDNDPRPRQKYMELVK